MKIKYWFFLSVQRSWHVPERKVDALRVKAEDIGGHGRLNLSVPLGGTISHSKDELNTQAHIGGTGRPLKTCWVYISLPQLGGISYFSHCCDEIPIRHNFREEACIRTHRLRRHSSSGRRQAAGARLVTQHL